MSSSPDHHHTSDTTGKATKPKSNNILQENLYPITLKFLEVECQVKVRPQGCWINGTKTILNGITGMVRPGEILAMLGPSGSGKTTLLTALGGRLQGKPSGTITYNDHKFTGAMKRRIGFVTQDDVFYPHLTVAETLLFTALLRLPQSLTRDEKAQHAESVIEELGLTQCRNGMVGGALVRGISGGERKRVSIGQEMLINPSLLLLDEPTSGLDSTTAQRIVTTLKRLAGGGRTVVTTIHQPSTRLYHMFDNVLLLSEGSPIYYGPGTAALQYFNSLGFSKSIVNINPADLLLDLANGIGDQSENADDDDEPKAKTVKKALMDAYDRNISKRLKAEVCSSDIDASGHGGGMINRMGGHDHEQWCTSWWHQFKVLMERGMRERRFEAFNRLRIFQVVSVAVVAGLLWWHTPISHIQDRVALIFFFSVFWGFYPLYNAVFTFPQERRMLTKERSSGMYRLSSYFVARTCSDLPLELALPAGFVLILYWMGGLDPHPVSFLLFLLVVLLNVLVAQSLGLAMGAFLIDDVKQATTLASVTTLIFLIAGGYYVQTIPAFIIWLKYLSYSFYCYRLLLGVQYTPARNSFYVCSPDGQKLCRVENFPAVHSVGINCLWMDVFAMGLMFLGYRVFAYVALRRRLRMT